MKKSEMDELQILAASLRNHPTGKYIDVGCAEVVMKKSEMDKLLELEEDWRKFGYHDCIVGRLQRLLDTFEVDFEPINKVKKCNICGAERRSWQDPLAIKCPRAESDDPEFSCKGVLENEKV